MKDSVRTDCQIHAKDFCGDDGIILFLGITGSLAFRTIIAVVVPLYDCYTTYCVTFKMATTWSELRPTLSNSVLDIMDKFGFQKMTPVQVGKGIM